MILIGKTQSSQRKCCRSSAFSSITNTTWTGLGQELYVKVKVKFSRHRPGAAQRVGRVIAVLFHDRAPGKSRYPFYRRLG